MPPTPSLVPSLGASVPARLSKAGDVWVGHSDVLYTLWRLGTDFNAAV